MVAESMVFALFAFLAAGLVFGIAFVSRGVNQLDPHTRGTGFGFRLLILPGAVALWPWLLRRWLRRAR